MRVSTTIPYCFSLTVNTFVHAGSLSALHVQGTAGVDDV